MTKNILLYILEILKDTDEFNKYTRTEIEQRLKSFGIERIDRHTIKKWTLLFIVKQKRA